MGPTVVSSFGTIHFSAIYPVSDQNNVDDAEWINDDSVIDFKESGYIKYTCKRDPIFQRVEIPYDDTNDGVYKIVVNNKESNSIDVSLDGMFFSLLLFFIFFYLKYILEYLS